MKTHSFSPASVLGALVCTLGALTAQAVEAAPAPKLAPGDLQFFENKIRPVLVDHCYKCHSHQADKVKGGLLLDTRDGLLGGGNSGPAIEPGNPEDSLLLKAISGHDADLRMPPKGDLLTEAQVVDFKEWIRRGAPDPRLAALTPMGGVPGSVAAPAIYGGVGRKHWAFQPVQKTTPPSVKTSGWAQTPVDHFVLARLEAAQLAPNPAADKRTLIRRATFDLIGLPPTEQEVAAFLADTSPTAFAKVIDRLLASPHYGEQWGRHWLDIARYSDTKGDPVRRQDPRFPHAWTYRDYVIEAFNSDKPYDQFILEQLAADRLLAETAKKNKADGVKPDQSRLAALGFLTLGNQYDGNIREIVNDRIDVTTKAFLGLTVSCARCHDHKFDPIPTKDYYSLYGVFANSVVPAELPLVRSVPRSPELADYLAKLTEQQKKEEALRSDFAEFRRSKDKDREKRREIQRREIQLSRETGDLEATHPGSPPRANALNDVPRPKDYPVLLRGEAQNLGEVVPRRFLEVLSPDPKKRTPYRDGSGRLELARDIIDPRNPLTARVLVNRVWQHHFGEGFVATPDDLGNMSSPPTHPELLDYLAAQFVEGGWSIKKLHRQIMLSRVYQLSSDNSPLCAEKDPDNKLRWRHSYRRLDFEELHDSLLAIADVLDPHLGGKSVPLGSEAFATRRALYVAIDRANPPELLTQFDFPNPDVPSGRRYSTIVPQQSLFLMNSPLVIETARKLTHRPEFLALKDDHARVASLYDALFQRVPNAQEIAACLKYIKANPGGTGATAKVAPAARETIEKNNRQAQRDATLADTMSKSPGRRQGYQPEPAAAAFKTREPLDAWTKLTHALFQTNDALFID